VLAGRIQIDPDLVEPFLAPHQRLVLEPTTDELAVAHAAIVRAASGAVVSYSSNVFDGNAVASTPSSTVAGQ